MIHKLVRHESRTVRALTIAVIVVALWDVILDGGDCGGCEARQAQALRQNTVAVTLR